MKGNYKHMSTQGMLLDTNWFFYY